MIGGSADGYQSIGLWHGFVAEMYVVQGDKAARKNTQERTRWIVSLDVTATTCADIDEGKEVIACCF